MLELVVLVIAWIVLKGICVLLRALHLRLQVLQLVMLVPIVQLQQFQNQRFNVQQVLIVLHSQLSISSVQSEHTKTLKERQVLLIAYLAQQITIVLQKVLQVNRKYFVVMVTNV